MIDHYDRLGWSAQRIANKLKVTRRTVEWHRKQLRELRQYENA